VGLCGQVLGIRVAFGRWTTVCPLDLLVPPPSSSVRLILGISLLLVGIGMWSCQIDGSALVESTSTPTQAQWVRTANGWERATWLPSLHITAKTPEPESSPQLHPLVLAAGQLLVSLLALTACGGSSQPALTPRSCK
jgi:hypothetical protein